MKQACSKATTRQQGSANRTNAFRKRPVLIVFGVLLALAGVGFSIGVPLVLGYDATLAALRRVSPLRVTVWRRLDIWKAFNRRGMQRDATHPSAEPRASEAACFVARRARALA